MNFPLKFFREDFKLDFGQGATSDKSTTDVPSDEELSKHGFKFKKLRGA